MIAYARRKGRGEHSGLEVSDHVVQVFAFEGEKCVQVREFYDEQEALRWAGAEESAARSPGGAEEG